MSKNQKSEKLKALETTLKRLTKTYGKGSVMQLGDEPIVDVESISSGSLGVDVALGVGGFARGRVIEIYGDTGTGKTTNAIHAIAQAQKVGGIVAFIDVEHAFDPTYAKALGVDVDNLIFSQPDYGEQALEIAEALIRSNAIDIIIIDSVAALVPKSELEGEMGQSTMGVQARLMSQAMRKLTGAVSKSGTCCIFINQTREKIGVMFGSNLALPAGNALKFYCSQRLEISRKGAQIKDREGNVVGHHVKVKVVKNKLAPPFKVAEFDIEYGKGISKVGEIVDLGVELDIVQKAGAWYSYNDQKIGQGRENAKQFLDDNPEVSNEIENLIREALK